MKTGNNNENLFCQYCPCTWCDGNKEGNEKETGYAFIPDPDHCKKEFEKEKELTYDLFLQSIFALCGSDINTDWYRWLDKPEDAILKGKDNLNDMDRNENLKNIEKNVESVTGKNAD
jgi:hypothetical protein